MNAGLTGSLSRARCSAFLTCVRAELGRLSQKILDERIWSLNSSFSLPVNYVQTWHFCLLPNVALSGKPPFLGLALNSWLFCPRQR